MSYATGYFGVPGSSRGNFTVHAVLGERPLCGWHPRKNMEFQWCAHGFHYGYIECETCKRRARKIVADATHTVVA